MSDSRLPKEPSKAIRSALREIGYTNESIETDYPFAPDARPDAEAAPADVVTFYAEPHDQSTSAVAVRWLVENRRTQDYLLPLRDLLWAPYAIIASAQGCDLWETLSPEDPSAAPRLVAESVPYPRLETILANHMHKAGWQAVARNKRQWRQMALYEVDPKPNAFLEWAYRPTERRLATALTDVFKAARRALPDAQQLSAGHSRWLLRLIGVRILWDKRWIDAGNRLDPEAILRGAQHYPTRDTEITDISQEHAILLASVVASVLGTVHLGAADGGILSQIVQGHAISGDIQRAWKLYPTPRHIAWHMVSSLPFEVIPTHERRVWDGTCGTGTILVAALDRLRALVPDLSLRALRNYLTQHLAGNDQAAAMADASRIALDLALGAPAGPDWRITTGDVRQATFPHERPNIVLGNPPPYGHGWTPNTAAQLFSQYQEILPSQGLISLIVPASLGSSESAKALRRRLVEQNDWYEVTELPAKTIPGMSQEALVMSGAKRITEPLDSAVVTWRRMDLQGNSLSIETLRQHDWLKFVQTPLVPPLALRLHAHLRQFPVLAEYVSKPNRSVGITPGITGHADVLDAPEPGSVRFLTALAGFDPFSISWERCPRWLRYSSSRIHWDRRPKERLFQLPKVLLSRQGQGRSVWRTRAVVDAAGLYPSDSFIAMAPDHSLTLEFLAGVFNSALFNCWLDLFSFTGNLTQAQLSAFAVPTDGEQRRRVAQLGGRLGELHAIGAGGADRRRRLILDLDAAVFDAYAVPSDLRADIATYLLRSNDPRPGFDRPVIAVPPVPDDSRRFTPTDADRLQQLFDTRQERELTADERGEMERLVTEWQHMASEAAGTKGVPAPEPTLSAWPDAVPAIRGAKRDAVRRRAKGICEYCRIAEEAVLPALTSFQAEHFMPQAGFASPLRRLTT